MNKVFDQVLPPREGLALELKQGQHLRVIQVEGQQVVDFVVWNRENLREKLSTAYSRNRYFPDDSQAGYFPKDTLTEGDWLMSTLCRPLMTIVADTPRIKGVHGSHHRMCNRFFYRVYGESVQEGCHEILSRVSAPYGLLPEDMPDSVDLFMNYPHDCDAGHFEIREPIAEPGDYVELRAEMDCLVALSNCPEDQVSDCNAGICTSMRIEVHEDPDYTPKPVLSPDEWLEQELAERGLVVK